jgi:hypothetical protein
MNYTLSILILTIIIFVLSIYIYMNEVEENFYFSDSNSSSISNFTTNKFLYPGGYISPQDCTERCNKRFEECTSNYPTGTTKWCEHLKTECTRDCKWNSVFN